MTEFPRNTTLPHMRYRVEFNRSGSNLVGVGRGLTIVGTLGDWSVAQP